MQKVYMVGKVTGEENWEDKFKDAEWEYSCYNPESKIKTPRDYPKGLTQKEYMKLSCESVFWADKVVVTPGWETSKGTMAEIALAYSFGLPVEFMGDNPEMVKS